MAMRGLLLCFVCLVLQPAVTAAPLGGQMSERDASRRCIRGTVISSATAQGLDATVTLSGYDYSSTSRTSSSGLFAFCGVSRGSYALEVFAPGHEWTRTQVMSDSDPPDSVSVVVRPLLRQALPHNADSDKSVSVRALKVPRRAREELDRFLRDAEKNDWQESLASLRKAVEIYPDYVDAWTNMGVVYTRLNDFSMAEAAFKRALEIGPNDAVIRRKLGYLYLVNEKWDKALAELKISKSLNPSDARTGAYLERVLDQMGKAALGRAN